MTLRPLILVIATLALAGCGDSGGGDTTTADGSGSTTSSADTTGETGTNSQSGSQTGGSTTMPTSATATESTGTESETLTTSPVTSASTGGVECDENHPDECTACQGEKCCDLLQFCAMDPDCLCVAECVGMGGLQDVMSCPGTCQLDSRPDGWGPLEECLTNACPDSDECSAP